MADESSKKAMSLNQLHNRLIVASHSKSTASNFLSAPKTLISTMEQADDDVQHRASHDEPDTTGLPHSSAEEKIPSKVMNKEEVSTAQEAKSSVEDDIDTQHGEELHKVKLHGRRRLCKPQEARRAAEKACDASGKMEELVNNVVIFANRSATAARVAAIKAVQRQMHQRRNIDELPIPMVQNLHNLPTQLTI